MKSIESNYLHLLFLKTLTSATEQVFAVADEATFGFVKVKVILALLKLVNVPDVTFALNPPPVKYLIVNVVFEGAIPYASMPTLIVLNKEFGRFNIAPLLEQCICSNFSPDSFP